MGRRDLIGSGDKHLVPSEHSPLAVKLAAVKRHQKPLVMAAKSAMLPTTEKRNKIAAKNKVRAK